MDGFSGLGLVKAILPRTPMIFKTALYNSFSLSEASQKQDLRTELTVNVIRSFMTLTVPVSKQQKASMRDPGVSGPMWVSKVALSRPEESDVQEALIQAIEHLKDHPDQTYEVPAVKEVEAEWTGFRAGVSKDEPEPQISEKEKYEKLMQETRDDLTILYFHGGALFLMDPCTHRRSTSHLAKRTGGRVLSVRYRLAPQNPFPAAILDALVVYLSLLAPPEGSLHAPVPAKKVVFAGDSAGGNISLALFQTLLALQRISPGKTIRFHGKDVPIELPGGAALNSPWCDITRSMPSVHTNGQYDYLSGPKQDRAAPYVPTAIPADHVWPCKPPRVEPYCNAAMLTHPMVSPIAAAKDSWAGAPPIFITMGEEGLSDEGMVVARRAHAAGASVALERIEGMPHCFALIMPGTPAAKRCMQGWAGFCADVSRGQVGKGVGEALWTNRTATESKAEPIQNLLPDLPDEEVDRRLNEGREWRVAGEKELLRNWEESEHDGSKSKL